MNAEEFNEMSVEEARGRVEKHGLKILIKKSGEFYDDFFSYGVWRPDFKAKLSILVEHGLDLNQPICERWREKNTPIFQVLSSSGREVASAIKVLAEFGADINLPDQDGRTPIMVACTGRYQGDLSKPSVVKALIKAGADLSLQDPKGNLVADLADHKSLPALVAAGAPFNVRKSDALWKAVWGKDLNLAHDLLQRGLKKKLESWNLQVSLPFLETIARTYPDLFQRGFSLEDTERRPAGKQANRAFKALIDMCSSEPKSNSADAIDEDVLPPSLRLGAWPPKKPEPTAPISIQSSPAMEGEFRFPPEIQAVCEELCTIGSNEDARAATGSRFSQLIETIERNLAFIEKTDWDEATRGFIKDFNSNVRRWSRVSRIGRCRDILEYHQDGSANAYYVEGLYDRMSKDRSSIMISRLGTSNTFRKHVDVTISVDTVGDVPLRIWSNDDSLLCDQRFIKYATNIENGILFIKHMDPTISIYDIGSYETKDLEAYINIFEAVKLGWNWNNAEKVEYCALAYKIGKPFSVALQRLAQGGDLNALSCLTHFNAETLSAFMAECLSLSGSAKYAQAWLRNFPDTAIEGLLKCSFGSDLNDRGNAQQALRHLAADGSRHSIVDCALKFGEEAHATAIEFLGYDPRADFLPKKKLKLPAYFIASAHPAPKLKSSGEALPPHAVETLARMILVSTCHFQNSALQEVIEACDRHSLAEFALSAFDVWSRNGAKKDGVGFLYGLAYLGDDRAAVMLAKNYKNATPTAVAPVVEVLVSIGSNAALAGLQAIARSNLNETSQGIAKHALDDVARDRGLSPDMLEDLAVPDLGLDQSSQLTLDFGPRCFSVTLDANLDAVLTDESGIILKALPKATKIDNAQLAKAATAQWKEFKSALKGQATYQKKRFEQAMLLRREWDSATFKEIVTIHPLLSKMVCTLVWATVKGDEPDTAFRIDTDGRYVTADGAELTFDDEAMVTPPHPLLLGDKVDTWLQIFADNKLTQPFPQLARKWFAEGPETEDLIRARDGTKVPLGSLRGLKAKGWEFEEGGAGMVWSVYKHAEGARASIDVEPGWSLSGYDFEDFGGDQTVKLDVSGSDPITYSELVREFLSLPVAEG